MRRREQVTTQPPPEIAAFEDPAQLKVIRDIYDHLFIEQAAVSTTTVQQPAATWTDRGDPAASDWDEATLTADSAWHDLNLTGAGVPAAATLVLLRVVIVTGIDSGQAYFRTNGNSNALNVSAVLEISDDQGRDVWVTPATGVIEYKLVFTAALNIDVTVGGWWA